jgi:hypothetical protein
MWEERVVWMVRMLSSSEKVESSICSEAEVWPLTAARAAMQADCSVARSRLGGGYRLRDDELRAAGDRGGFGLGVGGEGQ